MKFIWLLLFSSVLYSQTTPTQAVVEPQYMNNFYALGPKGELIELEHQTGTFKAHAKSFIAYSSVKAGAEFKPAHSPIHLSPDVQFVVRGRIPQNDPASRFDLRIVKVAKGHREIVMTSGHGTIIGASATSTLDSDEIPLRFEEYGQNSYRITPVRPLDPGEYAIGLKYMYTDLYCFGVYR